MCPSFALLLGKVVIGNLLRMTMRVIINCRSVDIVSYECGSSVSCWGSTSADICTASVQFIRWNIVVTNEQGMEEEITVSRNSRDSSPPPRERIIKFTFTRVSGESDLPLITTLAINSTGIGLNGTVVRCRDAKNPGTMISISTIIKIISNSELAIQNYLCQ